MGIALEGERKPQLPVVKRTALGQRFYGAVVKIEQRDRLRRDEATRAMVPLINPKTGKPSQELVVTCLTLPGTTAPVGLDEDEHVPEVESLVRLILKGKAFADWIASKADLPDQRPVEVGDIVTQITERAQVYDQNGEKSGAEITDQATLNGVPRGRSIGIYGPVELREPKNGSPWTPKAEAAYHSLKTPIAAESAAPPADPWGPPDSEPAYPPDDEPPF